MNKNGDYSNLQHLPNEERVKKENDHAMDEMRYFVSTVLAAETRTFAVYAVERKTGREL